MNSQLVLLKLSVEGEMHGVGRNLGLNPMTDISLCYKASILFFYVSFGCYCAMISSVAILAHCKRFLYDDIEVTG